MHLLEADESAMNNAFETTANLTLYDVTSEFENSFTCCDWSDTNDIAIGNENGELCLTKLDSLLQNQNQKLTKISDQPITCVSFSDQERNLLAIGNSNAELIFIDLQGQLVYKCQCRRSSNGDPSITAIRWNPKVSKVVASACQNIVQIHNTQKQVSIQTLTINQPVVDIIFSYTNSTTMYILTQEQLYFWGLKEKQPKIVIDHKLQSPTHMEYIEDVDDIIGIFTKSGYVAYLQCSSMKIVGVEKLGQIFSLQCPNLFASYVNNQIQLDFHCMRILDQPILFDSKILNSQKYNIDELLFDTQKLLKLSDISQNGQNLIKYQINDSQKLNEIGKQIVEQKVQIESKEINQLLQDLQLDEQQFINKIISSQQQLQKIEFITNQTQKTDQQSQQQKQQSKMDQNDEDFFNNLDENDNEDYEEEIEEIIEETQNYDVEQYKDINQYLLNGQYEDSLNVLLNQQKYDLLLQLLNILPLNQELKDKYMNIYNQNTKQYQQVLNIATLIKENKISDLDCNWKQKIILGLKQKVNIKQLAQQLLEQSLPMEDQIQLLILLGQKQEAVQKVLSKQNPSLQQKIQIEIELNKLKLTYYKNNVEKFIKTLRSGGEITLSEQISHLTGVNIQQNTQQHLQQPAQQNIQQNQVYQHNQRRILGNPHLLQPQQFSPQQQHIQNQEENIFVQNQQLNQQNQIQEGQIMQQPFSIPSFQPQQPNNQFMNQNILQQDVLNVVDLGMQNLNQQQNQNIFQIQGQQQSYIQPPQVQNQVQQFNNQIQQQLQPQILDNNQLLLPTMNQMQQQQLYTPPPQIQQSPFQSQIQPLPQNIQNQPNNIITHTTAPQKMQIVVKPIQQLQINLKSLDLLNSVQIKTDISERMKQIALKFHQKDQFNFQKNAKKISELLIYLSDYQEVKNLLSENAIQTINQYINYVDQGRFQEAKQLIVDYSLQSDDLTQFNSTLKLMAK